MRSQLVQHLAGGLHARYFGVRSIFAGDPQSHRIQVDSWSRRVRGVPLNVSLFLSVEEEGRNGYLLFIHHKAWVNIIYKDAEKAAVSFSKYNISKLSSLELSLSLSSLSSFN